MSYCLLQYFVVYCITGSVDDGCEYYDDNYFDDEDHEFENNDNGENNNDGNFANEDELETNIKVKNRRALICGL